MTPTLQIEMITTSDIEQCPVSRKIRKSFSKIVAGTDGLIFWDWKA